MAASFGGVVIDGVQDPPMMKGGDMMEWSSL